MQHANTSPPDRPREAGFTLVEIIVALVIIAILGAVAMMTFGGAKDATRNRETLAAAASYHQAIGRFLADHANAVPRGGGDFAGGLAAQQPAGPLDLDGKPYIGSVPDGVAAGRIGVSMNCGSPGGGAVRGFVAYCPLPDPDYELRVWTIDLATKSLTTSPSCYLGHTAKTPRC